MDQTLPIQPVDNPIICNPYAEPQDHWLYDPQTGEAKRAGIRRDAGYWYKEERAGSAQMSLLAQEHREDMPLVNLLREEVRRWRESGYRGATNVTRALLEHWARVDRDRRLFFCQREAVETMIYLAELRIPGKSSKTGFRNFPVDEDSLQKLLRGEKPDLRSDQRIAGGVGFYPTLVDLPYNKNLLPLRRLGCKMATGSGKTVVMAMLIAWAFCNRGQNPQSRDFPAAVLICCPNLTVKERLQVLRPEVEDNYYAAFDIVPHNYRHFLQAGKVLVTNWHAFAPESEHREGDKTYTVVNKGPETPEVFARRVLGDLFDRMPILVLNDEGHHCWRPKVEATSPSLSGKSGGDAASTTPEERKRLEEEAAEATVWVEGLDRINNGSPTMDKPGILMTVDLSATPFYIKGSGYPEGRPFPWLVSDFGLVDAIESGITKIPRLPVQDTTGRPDPKYFKLWETIRNGLAPREFLPGKAKKPKPEVVYREAEGALQQIAGQWKERFDYVQSAAPGADKTPPVLIIVCDNTDIAEVFYRNISGESDEAEVTPEDVEAVVAEAAGKGRKKPSKASKGKTRTVFGKGRIQPDLLSNTPERKHTIRIDSKLLAEAESEEPGKTKSDLAEHLRRVVATVGKVGQPGEQVRCVVSVSMLTEGWDANNVTHILGLRAFGSQLLCEQVVGRGLRRMDYTPEANGLLRAEYVDVYGIPFSVIPFKGRTQNAPAPEDKPTTHVQALPERAHMEVRFPVVEGYVFALKRNIIRCDVDATEPLYVEPFEEPTATFVRAATGYYEGHVSGSQGLEVTEQNREVYYANTHLQTILFEIARQITSDLIIGAHTEDPQKQRVMRLQSRHQLFPQVFAIVQEYVEKKVRLQGADERELGLELYARRMVERIREAIEPDHTQGEPPLLPVLNRYKSTGTSAEVGFKTIRPCRATQFSHVNQVVVDAPQWESSAAFHLERLAQQGQIRHYVRNDHLGLLIPYEYLGLEHTYEPDFVICQEPGQHMLLEIKGQEDEQDRAKHEAARKWVRAANHWGQLGQWRFMVCKDPRKLGTLLPGLLVHA